MFGGVGGGVGHIADGLSIDRGSKGFSIFWLGDVRYFGCTKDYSSVLESAGGLGGA